jgi:hypothetical protein
MISLRSMVALYLAFIAALTFPHIITVSLMDWHQGVWFTKRSQVNSQAKNLMGELQNKDRVLSAS